jgi:hypothetical protein
VAGATLGENQVSVQIAAVINLDWLLIPLIIAAGFPNSAVEAYGKHIKIDKIIERNTSEELRARVGQVGWITKSIVEQRITLQWTF